MDKTIFLFIFLTFLPGIQRPMQSIETGPMRRPTSCLVEPNPSADVIDGSYMAETVLGMMDFYKKCLQPAISRGCPSLPSCSSYMILSIHSKGFTIGIVLGLERLIHESGEMHHGNIVETEHGLKILDPIDNNTFWWKSIYHDH